MKRHLGQLPGRRKKQGTSKKLAARIKSKGKELKVVSLGEELGEFYCSEGDGFETVNVEHDRRGCIV